MGHVIHKQQLEVKDTQQIDIPVGAEILCVQTQAGVPCVWYKFKNGETETHPVTFKTYATGQTIEVKDGPVDEVYLGTYQILGTLVFHVYLKRAYNEL